jgi:hypothetical protein
MMRRMPTVAPPPAPTQQVPGTPQAGRWMQTVHADVTVPFEASAITGAMITSIGLLIAGSVIYWQRWLLLDVLIPLALGALGLWLSTTLIFWFRERQDIKTTWWRAEERDQVDYTGDGQIGRPEAMQVRLAGDAERKAAEDLTQQRLEEFIVKLYNAEKRTTLVIRRLGFTEAERTDFIRELRAASLIRSERGGNSSSWAWTYDDPEKTIALARKRIIWRVPA